jgi:hypothetical protein
MTGHFRAAVPRGSLSEHLGTTDNVQPTSLNPLPAVLALFKNVEIRADTDDLGCGLEGRAEILNDRRPKPYRAFL